MSFWLLHFPLKKIYEFSYLWNWFSLSNIVFVLFCVFSPTVIIVCLCLLFGIFFLILLDFHLYLFLFWRKAWIFSLQLIVLPFLFSFSSGMLIIRTLLFLMLFWNVYILFILRNFFLLCSFFIGSITLFTNLLIELFTFGVLLESFYCCILSSTTVLLRYMISFCIFLKLSLFSLNWLFSEYWSEIPVILMV